MMKESVRLRGDLSPLVFSSSGGMAPTAMVVYKWNAALISEKRDHPYCHEIWPPYRLLLIAIVYIAN